MISCSRSRSKGTDSPQNQAKREALWERVSAINSSGGFGHWAWDRLSAQ